jgi:hypothetical protein
VREWGQLKEPDNTLVPQLTYRELQLVEPLKSEIRVLQQQNALLDGRSPQALVVRAVEAEERANRLERQFKQLEAKYRNVRDDHHSLKEEVEELRVSRPTICFKLPPVLLKGSDHARKHCMVAFHPDKQPCETTKELATVLFKQASAAQEKRSAGVSS